MPAGYGRKIKKKLREIQIKRKKRYKCPACSRISVSYISMGIWECKKCKKKFASDAYEFKGR